VGAVSTFPDTLATIARIMPTYHFANLGGRPSAGYAPDLEDVLILVAWSAAIFALVAWRYRRHRAAGAWLTRMTDERAAPRHAPDLPRDGAWRPPSGSVASSSSRSRCSASSRRSRSRIGGAGDRRRRALSSRS
jgi:hypothetical protein